METCTGLNTWTQTKGSVCTAREPPTLNEGSFLWQVMVFLGLQPQGDSLSRTLFSDVHVCPASAGLGERRRLVSKSKPIGKSSVSAAVLRLVVSAKPWPMGVASWLTVNEWLRGVVSSKGVGSVHMKEVMAIWLVEREALSRSQRAARTLGYNMMAGLSLASTALRV